MGTAALDLEGKVIWRQTGLTYSPVHGTGGSPVLVDGMLVFSCDGAKDPFVAALDAATGEIRWKTPRQTTARKPFSFATPLAVHVDGATQIISPGSGFVGSYDLKDGHELWRVSYGEGYSVIPRPVFAHDLLFVSSSFDKPVLKAIRPSGAKGDSTSNHIAWEWNRGVPHSASMLVVGDELYFVSDGGIASCVDARTGKLPLESAPRWRFLRISRRRRRPNPFLQNETGISYVVKADKTYQLLATNPLEEPDPRFSRPRRWSPLVRSENHLWRIGRPM